VLMMVVETRCGHQERKFGDRRKSEEKPVAASNADPVLMEGANVDRASGSAESHREDARGHLKLLIWDQGGGCHEGRTPYIGNAMMFVESTWMAPVDSEVTISVVPKEGDAVGQELTKGRVVWHCPQDDEFKNQAGFGVLLQQHEPQGSGPDLIVGGKQ